MLRGRRPVAAWEGPSARRQYAWLAGLGSLLPGTRGLRRLTLALGRCFAAGNAVILRHEGGFSLRVELGDPYWTRLLFSSCRYEPQVEAWLRHALPRAELFIDGGANTGFWTLFAARRVPRVIAVEPSAVNFGRLRANVALEGGGAELIRAALWDESGRTVELAWRAARHAAAHVVTAGKGARGATVERVRTLTLDDLRETFPHTVLKLDIEGAEIAALRGAPRLLAARPLILYEDHGNDPECRVSRFLLDGGLRLFAGVDKLRELHTAAEVAARKYRRRHGYDLLACHPDSSFLPLVEELLEARP